MVIAIRYDSTLPYFITQVIRTSLGSKKTYFIGNAIYCFHPDLSCNNEDNLGSMFSHVLLQQSLQFYAVITVALRVPISFN